MPLKPIQSAFDDSSEDLMRRRDPRPLDVVRVQRLCQLNKNGLLLVQVVATTWKGVNHVTFPKVITCDLALPVPLCVGSEVSIPHAERFGRRGSGEVHTCLCRTTGSGNCGVERAGGSRSFAGTGATEGVDFRIHGDAQRPNSHPGVQQVPTPQTPPLLG